MDSGAAWFERDAVASKLWSTLDEWIEGLEAEAPLAAPEGETPVRQPPQPGTARSGSQSENSKSDDFPVQVHRARTEPKHDGDFVRFGDRAAEWVFIQATRDSLSHPGTKRLASRRPELDEVLRSAGVDQTDHRPIRFFLNWFVRPGDAVEVDRRTDALRWGACRLSGRWLGKVLDSIRAEAPEDFERLLYRYGVDASDEGSVYVFDPDRAVWLAGRAAMRVLCSMPVLIGALVRIARTAAGTRSQLRYFVDHTWGPVHDQIAANHRPLQPLGEAERGRCVAAAIHLVATGERALMVDFLSGKKPPGHETLMELVATQRRAGKLSFARDLAIIATSSELEEAEEP